MKFLSTRNSNTRADLRDALLQGLAPDGGLFHPAIKPDLSELYKSFTKNTSFAEMSGRIFHALCPEDFSLEASLALTKKAFPFEPQITELEKNHFLLELYHGPSCAFKDFGASFLATIMEEYLSRTNEKAVILTATSGDTGSAVAQAFYGKKNISVVILYPKGRVSPSQEMQLTTLGGNVEALEVEGSFDDCQRMVKEAFLDNDLRSRVPITSANSISLGRLLPQSFYYAWAFTQLKDRGGEICFTVPSGNFGNLTAGIMAWSWGLRVSKFIAVTNANDIVPHYLKSGRFEPRASETTLSNAMDVGNPSNFERLLAIFNADQKAMRVMIHPEVVSDLETKSTMKKYLDTKNKEVCPHTAVGLVGSERYLKENDLEGGSIITLSTAHPGKFSEVMLEATGKPATIPDRLLEFMKREKKSKVIPPDYQALKKHLLG